jgi:DNA-binding NarL/FixJ family response regulator
MKVLLVDDHALFRAGLRLLTQSIHPGAMVFEAATINSALQVVDAHPDLSLCLLDIHLSYENGLHGLGLIKSAIPQISVVVISAEEHLHTVTESINAGAMGFIPKSAAPIELSQALARVMAGEIYLPQHMKTPPLASSNSAPVLSPRQWEVFHCLMRGLPNKLICRELELSDNTVKSHLMAIFRNFEVHTRTQLVLAANKMTNIPNIPNKRL